MKTVFSGIQPSGNLHIGNYIGALEQWVKMQEYSNFTVHSNEGKQILRLNNNSEDYNYEQIHTNYEFLFCIVDLHAITVPQDPSVLKEKTKETAAIYLAAGIDPEKSHIFVQGQNPDHTYLAWIFNTISSMGQLNRMIQFKDKSRRIVLKWKDEEGEVTKRKTLTQEESKEYLSDRISVGLFDYPALMAADILLYDADEVPVGEDQKQHIELTRDIAEKFNKMFGETFKIPAPRISKDTARIMSLQNPDKKMSKSDIDPLGTVNILDSEEEIREKVKKAVTDSGSTVGEGGGAGITNLLAIYAAMKNIDLTSSIAENDGKSYSAFKTDLADLLVGRLSPIREKYEEIRKDESYLNEVLSKGLEYAMGKSTKKVADVREKVGLI